MGNCVLFRVPAEWIRKEAARQRVAPLSFTDADLCPSVACDQCSALRVSSVTDGLAL
jgi:hypothetical protein